MRSYKIYTCLGIVMLISEIWKQWCLTFLLGGGNYNWWYFPFQLCSVPMYVCLLIPHIKKERSRQTLLVFLMDFGLLAGIFTFFDTSGLHYSYLPLTVHSYLWHILLIFLGLYTGISGRKDPARRAAPFFRSALLYFTCCLLATICNLVFHAKGSINMFYMSPYYRMNQKVFRHITSVFGNTAGILSYAAAILSGAWIIHRIWNAFYLHASGKSS